jgi:hypothetical protein
MPEFFSGDWSKFSDDLENLFLFYVSLQHCIDSSSNVVIERVVVQFFPKKPCLLHVQSFGDVSEYIFIWFVSGSSVVGYPFCVWSERFDVGAGRDVDYLRFYYGGFLQALNIYRRIETV